MLPGHWMSIGARHPLGKKYSFQDRAYPTPPLPAPLRLHGISPLRQLRFLPAAAERANQIDARAQLQSIEIERLQLALQQRRLRSHDGEIVGCALLVERQREV